jgi:hypothetical protein
MILHSGKPGTGKQQPHERFLTIGVDYLFFPIAKRSMDIIVAFKAFYAKAH